MEKLKTENIKKYYPGYFSEIDIHFAGFMSECSNSKNPALFLAAALVSRNTGLGHVCIDISSMADKQVGDGDVSIICPGLSEWMKTLTACSAVGKPGDYKPMILDSSARLYLYRYWEYEQKLAAELMRRSSGRIEIADRLIFQNRLCGLFSDPWQKLAAFAAVVKKFTVICGGPGTGKTTTVAKILALLIELVGNDLKIKITAPTGKAADRLQKALINAKQGCLKELCSDSVREAVPDSASTIHRLLGTVSGSARFRYNSDNPLSADVVVIDEASMVALPLMSKLFEALSPGAKVIIIGDKDQLASVESGAVLGDICSRESVPFFSSGFSREFKNISKEQMLQSGHNVPEFYDCIVELKTNYRFSTDSGISGLSIAVNEADGNSVQKFLQSDKYRDVSWRMLPQPDRTGIFLKDILIEGFGKQIQEPEVEDILIQLEQQRILCVTKQGPFGVSTINRLAEKILAGLNLINPCSQWYHGRPIMIVRNSYNLKLFNGDTGIILRNPENNGLLQAFFRGYDGNIRIFPPALLPEHETVFAMTVHKSQGSEFENVLMILPDKDFPVLTRELIYTGITRAKKRIEIWTDEEIFKSGIRKQVKRTSGLGQALYGNCKRM